MNVLGKIANLFYSEGMWMNARGDAMALLCHFEGAQRLRNLFLWAEFSRGSARFLARRARNDKDFLNLPLENRLQVFGGEGFDEFVVAGLSIAIEQRELIDNYRREVLPKKIVIGKG